MAKCSAHRDKRIDAYLSTEGAQSPLHTLFLSHVHADHLNGLEQLLDGTTGLAVDTIVLPLVSVADRLIAYARTAVEDAASAQNEFYREFTIDPTAALSRFQPRQIIFVEPGNRKGGAPGGGDGPPGRPDGGAGDVGDVVGGETGKGGPAWVLVGTGQVRWNDARVQPTHSAEPIQALVIPDTMALMTPGVQAEWLLAPFVDPTLAASRNRFLDALAAGRRLSRRKLDEWLVVTANVQRLVTADLADLTFAGLARARQAIGGPLCRADLQFGEDAVRIQGG